ncbi:cadmium resistance transporter [Aerosakkonemataceae cyanobacterium BLCC-F50]|uniref:Cadmium resistance transporter n=1 Tax=Floridaenema flaviceps BLCC-F50 TaxID=3153642 RepID=A0ABV4XTZ7_9CYAN
MSGLLTTIITGVTAFCATNIDDLAILLLLFSQKNPSFRYQQILFGQYMGFTILVITSLPGFLGRLVITQYAIGLLGFIPIILGLDRLLNKKDELSEVELPTELSINSILNNLISPQTYTVAALTIANGTDNISVYVPLFAHSSFSNLLVIISIFFWLLGVWCYAAQKLKDNLTVARLLTSYCNSFVAVFLIILGIFIVLDSQVLNFTKLFFSCLCLVVLVKKESENDELIG